MRITDRRDFLLLLVIFDLAKSRELFWRFSSDIFDTQNWIGGKLADGCKGVHFAPVNEAPVLVERLTTAELTLPNDGEISIAEEGFIEFEDNKRCIKLKPIDYHEWDDPDSWVQTDNNVAIPDQELFPCDQDRAIFPKPQHTRISSSLRHIIYVGSLMFGKKEVDYFEMQPYLMASVLLYRDQTFVFLKSSRECTGEYGCLCHSVHIPCPFKENQDKFNCKDPITPESSCHDICGAYLTFEPDKGPTLNEIRQKIKEYSSDTHASRVLDYTGKEVIQVVFGEKEYTGISLEEAESFLDYLKSSKVDNVQISKSGAYYREGSSSFPMIFGTFAAVVIFFGVLLYLNGNTSVATIVSRFNRGRGSVFSVPFFARFDNVDENLIIDGQSETGSVLDLPKSFDNPMYEQNISTDSTISGSTTEIVSEHENPLYEIAEDVEVEE